MRLVVDTNILFSFFKEVSLTRSLILNPTLHLISPEKSLTELNKYSDEISKKAKNDNFRKVLGDLEKVVIFIPKKEYSSYISNAEKFSPDLGDSDFFALCLKEGCPLWSNDSILRRQDQIKILSTKDIIDILI